MQQQQIYSSSFWIQKRKESLNKLLERMGSRYKRRSDVDRLSNLPDDLIHKILTLISIKQAVETSVLSSRWRYIWTSMSYLNFSSRDLLNLPDFSNFVHQFLTARNNQIQVSGVMLAFRGIASQPIVKRVLDYAFSHNVKQLHITCLHQREFEFPLSLFHSQSLKHLILTGDPFKRSIMTSSVWVLPSLVTLNLKSVTFYVYNDREWAALFSKCLNLKKLTLSNCKLKRLNGFNIRLLRLSSLTLENGCKGVNMVTPQLKNLTITDWNGKLVISAPKLSSLCFKNTSFHSDLSSNFRSLDKADICINGGMSDAKYAHRFVSLLQQVQSAKFLTLNMEIIESLSSSVELISHQPSPFTNLKSLKIYPADVDPEKDPQPKLLMSTEVKTYLLDSSSDANITVVSREEVRDDKNVAIAKQLMSELRLVLYRLNKNNSANITFMERDTSLMERLPPMYCQLEAENHRATKIEWHLEERMENIKCYWKDLNKELQLRQRNTLHTISRLQKIEQVLTRLPTSHRDKLQACLSSLCAEADIVLNNIMDGMRIQCDKKPNVYFHQLATSSHPTNCS